MNSNISMPENSPRLSFKKTLFLVANLCAISALIVMGANFYKNSNLFVRAGGEGPGYSIVLNAANAPTSASDVSSSFTETISKNVAFDYNSAKSEPGSHIHLISGGSIGNNQNTQITSLLSVYATFSGHATIFTGLTADNLNSNGTITSDAAFSFGNSPYFFKILNIDNVNPLIIQSMTIVYSCVKTNTTITFDSKGGTTVNSITQVIGSTLVAPVVPTKEGSFFNGWYSDELLTNRYIFTLMPDENLLLFADWTDDPYEGAITIEDFKALPSEDSDFHDLVGVSLIASADLGEVLVFADATGVMVAMSEEIVAVGDLIRVHGQRQFQDDFLLIGSANPRDTIVNIYIHGQTVPLAPQAMTVETFNGIDPTNTAYWANYVEISGDLRIYPEEQMPQLVDGINAMSVFPPGQHAYEYLMDYVGLGVIIRGIILPNMDETPLSLMFIFNGDEAFIDVNLDDEELLSNLEEMFRLYYEDVTYYPGQFIDLPSTHPLIEIDLQYTTFGPNAALFDLETYFVSMDITEVTVIDLRVTATLPNDVSTSFDIQLHVDPDLIITVAEFIAKPDDNEIFYVIKGIIIAIQPSSEDNLFLWVADETGIAYVHTNNSALLIGDLIIASGIKASYGAMQVMANEPSRTVSRVISHDNPNPLTSTVISLGDFQDLDPLLPSSMFQYYELTGTLVSINQQSMIFALTDSTYSVIVFALDNDARDILNSFVDTMVVLKGVSFVGGDQGSEQVFLAFANFPNAISAFE